MADPTADLSTITADSSVVLADGTVPVVVPPPPGTGGTGGLPAPASGPAPLGQFTAPVVYRTTAMVTTPRSRIITDVSAFYGLLNVDVIAVGNDVKAGELYNLCSTLVGDEPHLPLFGCDLPKRVFQPINATLLQQCTQDVYLQSKNWITDIEVVPSQCTAIGMPGGRFAGLVVGYQFAGDIWHLPVHLVEFGGPT